MVRGFSRFLPVLGGHIHIQYAVKVGENRAVDQKGVPDGFEARVSDIFFEVVDHHALVFEPRYIVLDE